MKNKTEVIINTTERNVTQKPRKTDAVRQNNKTETLNADLDYIKRTSHLIREFRYAREYTQPDIAKKTGIKQQMISRIDRNDLNPRLSTVKKYLEACGVDLDQLLQDALDKINTLG